ncbi:cytochrome c [Solimonas aquatica]|uniref:Cytochrome c n=1 Tax=Solimonas aquatica TaxID=489703 RepID=A0A1H9ILV5_9GAMM|nr:c-type cytochrome [Solimonas aquatica]SEQ75499.1 cytochrome c [Solimonas aquatica]
MSKTSHPLRAVLLGGALLLPVLAHADADRGADVFDEACGECHSVSPSLKNKKGPSLYGIVGRAAGQVQGFSYSDALLASGIHWTPDKIDAYINAPKTVIPGGKMKFDGMPKASERADVIDFLTQAGKGK